MFERQDMEKSLGKEGYPNYRSQLLQKALEEKKRLGLDESNVRLSSALKALQSYGHEPNDAASPGETEETMYGSHCNERHTTGNLPKQTKVTSPSTELQLLTSNSFGSNSPKDGKPLKSILKRTESPLNRVTAGNKSLPCNSNINMPFFLNNSENEDEFLYGKSVNEQLLRVGALYAKNKHNHQNKTTAVDSNTQNLKACADLPGIKNKNAECDLNVSANSESVFIQGSYSLAGCLSNSKTKCSTASFNSKASSDLSGYFSSAKDSPSPSSNYINKDTVIDLFAQDSKGATSPSGDSKKSSGVSVDLSGDIRSKNSVASFNVQSPKVSSDLSSYAALLSFSKTGVTNIPNNKKNVLSSESSQKKDETYRENKTSNHAHGDLMCSDLYDPNSFKSPTTSSTVGNVSSKTGLVSVNKQGPNLLPRSIQKLQMKKTVDKKDFSFGAVMEKGIVHNSSSHDLLESTKKKNYDDKDVKPKPKNGETSLKKDELMLLTYVQNSRNLPRGKIKSDQITNPVLSGSITNSDCKPVKTCAEKSVSLVDKEAKCSSSVVPGVCSLESKKAVTDNAYAAETAGNSSELRNKSGFGIESIGDPLKPDSKSHALFDPPKYVSKICKNGTTGFPNRRKEFLSKLSSIKQKKKNSFFYQGKKSFYKELHSRRPQKRQRGLFVHEKVQGQIISKDDKYSRRKHFYSFNSEKAACAESVARKGDGKKYSLSPQISACDSKGFNSYSFDSNKQIVDNSSDHGNNRSFMLLRSSEIGSDSNLTSFAAKCGRKYNNLSPERLSDGGDVTDCTKKGRHGTFSALKPKRHSHYVRHSYAVSGRSPQRYLRKSSPPSHSLDWSPLRDGLDNGSRRCSVDLSPSRYSFNVSPKRQQHLDGSPSRHLGKESCELYSSDKSFSPHSFSRSPVPYSCDRSPSVSPFRTRYSYNDRSSDPGLYDDISSHSSSYVWSPDPHLSHRKCDSDSYDGSPDHNSYCRSPIPLSRDGSPFSGDCVRSLSPHYYGRDQDLSSHNQISSHDSCDGSIAPELCGKNSRMCSQELSLKRHSLRKGHEMHSFENSHVRHAIEISPTRLSGDRGPEKISVDISLRKLSCDRSLKKFSVNESHKMHLNELRPRKLSSGEDPRKKSSDVSSQRFRKSRIDSYHDRSDRKFCKSLHKKSCKNLKHSPTRSTENVFDSNNRFNERNVEANHSDSSQKLSSRVPKKSEQLNLVKPFGNNCNEPLVEKIPSSFHKISQHQKQHSIQEKKIVIPNVHKIVNAIDALVSNYNKGMANEKMHNITQGYSSQSVDSALNIKDPVHTQLNVVSGIYTSAYDQSYSNHAGNNSQFTYNLEFPQMSYPQYSVTPVDSCLPNYMQSSFSSQSPDNYQAESSDFQRITPVSAPYGRVAANVQASLSGAHRQCDAGGALSTVGDVYGSSCNATNELSEIFPIDESNDIACDDSRERVTTLTTVPLQSDELSEKNSSKYVSSKNSAVTMKFITPDKIEKLLRQKSEIRKQIGCLNDELEKLLKMQGNALRRKQREKGGHKDMLLLEYSKLQDEIKSHVNSLMGDMNNIEQELKNGFLGCTSDKENGKELKKAGECNEQSEDPSDYFEFYDSGSHWCKHCNKLCTTLTVMLEHVKSDEHLEHLSEIEKPWYSKPTTKKPIENEQKGQKITKPIKGVQFVMPVDGFYCSLCKEYFQKKTDMQQHLESLAHFEIYQNYTAENPTYERQWLMEKLVGLSLIEIEDTKTVSMEDKSLQKKQKKEEKARLREEEVEERFIQGREEQFRLKKELLQTVEERMDVKETMKHKVKKKHTEEEEQAKEENFQLRMDVVEKLDHRKEEKQGYKYGMEHKEDGKHKEKDEGKLKDCLKQDTLKRKKGKENEASNKIRILSCAQEAEKSDEKPERSGATDNFTVGKQSDPEAKWTVCHERKKLPLRKSNEPKSKPKQTVVYIGRAPNFKSHNKGNSSFRANLLKLALQKKEADMNLTSVTTSKETGINCVSNESSPAVTSTSSEEAIGKNAVNTCSPPSSECEVKQQICSQSSSKNVTNSDLQSNHCISILSTLEDNNVRSANNNDNPHRNLTCAPDQKSTTAVNTRSDFVCNLQSFKSDGSSLQENCDVTPRNAKHAKVPNHVHGPLTEEEDDYRVLGINKEDRLPLVLPKPPPAALIWPCYKDGTKVSDEIFCDKAATMTSDSDAPKNHPVNSDKQVNAASCSAVIHQNPTTSTAPTVENFSNLLDSQRNFSFTYGINTAQQQNINYSTNVQSKISVSFASVNGTRTSSVQQSYTYPYSSNTCSFQEKFMVHDKNRMPRFPAAQVPPPMQFQSFTPQMRYSCQQAPPPEYYNQKSINFYAGRYPQNQLPSPNVNTHQSYAPVFHGGKRFHAQVFRGSFKNKLWNTQRKVQTRPDVNTKEKEELISQVNTKEREELISQVNTKEREELISQIKTEEQVLDNTKVEKQVSCKAANIEGCAVNDLLEGNNLKTDSSSDTGITSRLESVEIFNALGNIQKSFPVGSQGDLSHCTKSCKENVDSRQIQVSPEDVCITNCGVSNIRASIYSKKRNTASSVAENNNSQQACEATTAGAHNSDTAFMTPVSCGFYDTNKMCENTHDGTSVKVEEGASQQNHLCKLKIHEGTPSLKSETCDRSTLGGS